MAAAKKRLRLAAPKRAGGALGLRHAGSYESETFYTHRLSLLSRLLARETRQMLGEPFRLSQMEWRILVQLEHTSPSKISEIHARSLLPKPQISSALPSLIEKGYVVRENDLTDARAPFFSITVYGLQLYRSVMRMSRKRQRRLELVLEAGERATFSKAIDELIAVLSTDVPAEDIDI
jgi:DNA-binding MarR family transcriptional regulator